jgi:uncharacterized delta-60 repeat protein
MCLLAPAGAYAAAAPELDPTFSGDGVVRLDTGHQEYWLDVDAAADGRVYTVGSTATRHRGSGLISVYTDTGRPDNSFSADGVAKISYRGKSGLCDVHALADGKVLVSGWARDGSRVILARFRHNGRLDRTFAGRGYVVRRVPDRVDFVALATDSQSNIYLAASPWSDWDRWVSNALVWKFTGTGKPVRSFGTNGRLQLDFARSDYVVDLVVDSLDRPVLLIDHYRPKQEMAPGRVVRLLADGALDPAFSSDGMATLRFPVRGGIFPLNIDVTPSDQIVVGSRSVGLKTTRLAVHKLQDDGSPDPGYSGDGVAWVDTGQRVSMWGGAEVLADGGYVFAGGLIPPGKKWPQRLLIAGITPEGQPDPDFGSGGMLTQNISKGWEYFTGLAIDPSGRLLVTGYDSPTALLVRLTPGAATGRLTVPGLQARHRVAGLDVNHLATLAQTHTPRAHG